MRDICDEELFGSNSAGGGSSASDDDEARAISVEILSVESMMRQAHRILARLLLRSGTDELQGSSPSPCTLRRESDGTLEGAYNVRRWSSSSARSRARPVVVAAAAAVGVKPKSPSGRVDRPRKRIPGALWSLSKTKRINIYGFPAAAASSPSGSITTTLVKARNQRKNGGAPPSQRSRRVSDLLRDASASDPALETHKRSTPGFKMDRAGETNKCRTLSVDGQMSEAVEGQQVARRGGGDGGGDGQAGPSKGLQEFESCIDVARRTEDRGKDVRSCQCCRHHETSASASTDVEKNNGAMAVGRVLIEAPSSRRDSFLSPSRPCGTEMQIREFSHGSGIETAGGNVAGVKDNDVERVGSLYAPPDKTAVHDAERSDHEESGDADKGGDRKLGQVLSAPKAADSGKRNGGPYCTASCWSGCSCPCHVCTTKLHYAPAVIDNNISSSSKICDRTTLVDSSGAASANCTARDIVGGLKTMPRDYSGNGERPNETASACVDANSLRYSWERRLAAVTAGESAKPTAVALDAQTALGKDLAIAVTSKRNASSTGGKSRAERSGKNGVMWNKGRRKARDNTFPAGRGRGRAESGRQREDEEEGSGGDICRSFLATSEYRGGPRRIHFGSAARRLSIGGIVGVVEARNAQGQGAGTERGGSRGYDLSAGEAMVHTRVKGFRLSNRARDPELARAESMAAAARAIGERISESSAARVTGSGAPGASQSAGGDGVGTDVMEEQTDDPTRVDSETPSTLRQEADEIGREGCRDPQNLVGTTNKSCPDVAVENRDEDVHGRASTAVSKSGRSKDTLGAEEEKHTPLVVKAAARTTTQEAKKAPEIAMAVARGEGVRDTITSAPALKRCSKPGSTHDRALPAAGPCHALLSHRSRVRSVVFSRPHTYQARKASRRTGEVSASPGPGQYEVDLGGFGRGNISGRAPMFASERYSLKAKARALVEARKAKTACLRGPGDYDIARAEGITRMKIPGVVSMRPPAASPRNASRRGQKQEAVNWRKTKNSMSKKRAVDTVERHARGGPCSGRKRGTAAWREEKRRGRGRCRTRSRGWRGDMGVPGRSQQSPWSTSSSLSLSLARGEEKKREASTSPRNHMRSGCSRGSFPGRRRRPPRQREREKWSCRSSSCGSFHDNDKEKNNEEHGRKFSRGDGRNSARSSRRDFSAKLRLGETSRGRSRGRPGVLSARRHCRRQQRSCFSSWAPSLSPLNLGLCRSRARSTESCCGTTDDNRCPGVHVRTPRSASRRFSATFVTKMTDDGPSSQSDSRGFSSSCGGAKWRSRRNRHQNDSGSTAIESVESRYEGRGNTSRNGTEKIYRFNGRSPRGKRHKRSHHRRRSSMCSTSCVSSDASYLPSAPGRDRSGERYSRITRGRRRQIEGSPLSWSTSVSSLSLRRKRRLRTGKHHLKRRARRDSSSSDTDRKRPNRDNGTGCYSRDEDSVWRGFLAISRKVPAWKFAPPEGKGVAQKDRFAVERARRQRERERTVGFHDVRRSLTEERTPCMASFAAQAEARSRERNRLKRRKPRALAMRAKKGQAGASCGQHEEDIRGSRRAWASEGDTLKPKRNATGLMGHSFEDDPTRRRPPTFRYVEEHPLPLQAARRLAEREAADRRRVCWLGVNVHKSWVNACRGVFGADVGSCGGGDVRMSEFGKTRGREEVKVDKKGQRIITSFNHVPRATDHMGPGRYETEDIARTTRRGRVGHAPVPRIALGVSREEAVGPRGERRSLDHTSEDEEGDILMLDVKDDFTTRRRRVPGGVLPSAPRWTEQDNNDGGGGDGPLHDDEAVLDIYPEVAGENRVGPRRDKGHRYLRFENQTGRSDDTAHSLPAAIVPPLGANDDLVVIEPEAAEGDVLRLNPREAWTGWSGGLVEMEKQSDRWTEDRGRRSCKREDGGEHDDDDDGGDILLLDHNHNAVRRKPMGAPAFEKQLGRRKWQAEQEKEEGILLKGSNAHRFQGENDLFVSTGRRPAPTSIATAAGGGRETEDPLERADRSRRPRSITLVDIDRQQRRRQRSPVEIAADDEFPPSPTTGFYYKDAKYDTARGIEFTKGRVGRGAVDMSRNQGRGLGGGVTRQGYYYHCSSDGDIDSAGNAQHHAAVVREGDELMLSPRWSALAVRPSCTVEWHRSTGTPRFPDAHGEVDREFGDPIGYDLEGVEAARACISRWRSSGAKTCLAFDMSKTTGRPSSSLHGVCETSPRATSLNATTTPAAKPPSRMEIA